MHADTHGHRNNAVAASAAPTTAATTTAWTTSEQCSNDSGNIDDAVDVEGVDELPAKTEEDMNAKVTGALILAESSHIVQLAWPIFVAYLLQFSLSLTSYGVFVGHVGTKELAASALTTMFCNVTGHSVGIGMASALDTLCSQGHTASLDKHALGKHLQRSIVVMLFLSIPIAGVWLFTREILLLAGQDPEISAISGVFARWMLLGLIPFLANDCLKRYLQSQGIVMASMWVTMIVLPINIFLQWLLVWSPFASLGIIGAPIATSISNTLIFLMTIGYAAFVQGHEAWGGWDWKEALDARQLWIFVKLGVPGIAMVCSEWWAFEIVALAAGLLGDNMLAAQTIALNTIGLTYTVPLALSIASSTRIGNSLGSNRPFSAKVAAITSYILGVGGACINALVLFSARNSLGGLYSNDPEVITIVASVMPLAALFQVSDGLGAVGGAVLRGCGRQHLGAYINLAGYYVIGLPVAIVAAFHFSLGLAGLWMGLTFALILASGTVAVMVVRTDWTHEAERALQLAGRLDACDDRGAYGAIPSTV
ncbi:mate-domain-containing protein [Entophlyctis helioformis]|nr:mate-domain-containing protein [Entophlyctis helioformis]